MPSFDSIHKQRIIFDLMRGLNMSKAEMIELAGAIYEATGPQTDAEITAAAESDPDNPPLTDEQLANMRPPVNVKKIRESLGKTQAQFALDYGLNLRTLQDWEQGRPMTDAARALFKIITRIPQTVSSILAKGEISDAGLKADTESALYRKIYSSLGEILLASADEHSTMRWPMDELAHRMRALPHHLWTTFLDTAARKLTDRLKS